MEPWLIYTILTYLIRAFTLTADKYLLDKKLKNNISYTIFIGMVYFSVIILIPFADFSKIPLIDIFFGLSTGCLFVLTLIFFFQALKKDDMSVIIPLGSLRPILILTLSVIFLKESLENKEIMAFFLFFIGGGILSIRQLSLKKIKVTPALKYILLSSTSFAVTAVLTKYLFSIVPVFEGFILLRIGTSIAALSLLLNKKIRKNFKSDFSGLSIKSRTIFISNQVVALSGHYFINLAISLGSISLINAASGLHHIFIFILAILCTIFFPNIIKEDLDKRIIIKKIAGITLVVLAVYFLNQ